MKFLYTTRSPYARKAHVVALEKDIPLELVPVDLTNKPQELTASNPLGRIPTLIIDERTSLCDSSVICEYLDNLTPLPKFIPRDPTQRIKTLNISKIADGMMEATVAIYMENLNHKDHVNDKFIAGREANIKRTLQYFEDHLDELNEFDLGTLSVACAVGYVYFRCAHLGEC